MRVFVAINLTDQERARLDAAARPLRESGFPVRWVAPQNVHLTLKFLGEVSDDRVPELAAVVGQAASDTGPFDMTVSGFGAFPSPRRPQVVWAGVGLNPTLAGLQEAVEAALETLGYERERRAFHPHLTLGRTRKQARPSDFSGFDELVQQLVYEDCFRVTAVDVMRSQLKPSGAVYSVVDSTGLEA